MIYQTSTEKQFEKLRRLLLKNGYDKSTAALQSLSRLRKALRSKGLTFQPIETEASNG